MVSENLDYIKTHTVEQVMTNPVICADQETLVHEVFEKLQESGYSGIPIVDNDHQVVGIVTQLDLLKLVKKGIDFCSVRTKDVMSKNVVTADKNALVIALVSSFLEHRCNRFPVTEEGKLVGIVSRHDVLAHLVRHQPHIFRV